MELREVYNGQLTYAANWDEYKRIPFWEDLDFIGVDAYFPVSEEKTPSIEQASLGWQKHKLQLKTMFESKERTIYLQNMVTEVQIMQEENLGK